MDPDQAKRKITLTFLFIRYIYQNFMKMSLNILDWQYSKKLSLVPTTAVDLIDLLRSLSYIAWIAPRALFLSELSKWSFWCNGYRHRKWTRRHEFKSWTRLIAFHMALIPLGKVWIRLFSLQLWVNSRTEWVLQPR